MKEKDKLEEILRLGAELNTIQDVDILLEKILLEARRYARADAGTIYVRQGNNLVFSHAQNDTKQRELPEGKKLIYTTFSVPINLKSIAGYVASTGQVLRIPNVYEISAGTPYSFDPNYDRLSGYRTRSMLTVPLKNQTGDVLGVLQIINAMGTRGGNAVFSRNDELYVSHFASSASMVLQRAQMTRALLLRMIQMAELRDPKETGAHVNRVASYAVEIYERWARAKRVDASEIEVNRDILRMAAMLHDAGKVAISDLILKKPARFTDEEYGIMKAHTYLGARLFTDRQSMFDEVAADVALTHHENWDGTGYPGHVDLNTGEPLERDSTGRAMPRKGEEIPLFGRIVALADVFDALSSRRVYKESWGESDVLAEIKSQSGKKFDPDLVDIFFDCMDMIRSIQGRYPDLAE
jgi:HD-GYP domain-containing protein (c-di-GMP phosphodiesterase class II)